MIPDNITVKMFNDSTNLFVAVELILSVDAAANKAAKKSAPVASSKQINSAY
jgi:hypothetical protein